MRMPNKILLNTMPRSGTVFMVNFLSELFNLNKLDVQFTEGIRVMPPRWNPYENDETYKLLKSGEILVSHYLMNNQIEEMIKDEDMLTLYLYRDPRDVMISIAYYYKYCNQNVVFYPYFSSLSDQDAIASVITGTNIPSSQAYLPENLPEDYDKFIWYEGIKYFCQQSEQWIGHPRVNSIQFEDFSKDIVESLYQVFQGTHYPISKDAIAKVHMKINFSSMTNGRSLGEESKSSHFRNGTIGQYKSVLSPFQKNICKYFIGNDLIRLNYESDLNW